MNNTEVSGHLLMAQLFCGVCAIGSQTQEDNSWVLWGLCYPFLASPQGCLFWGQLTDHPLCIPPCIEVFNQYFSACDLIFQACPELWLWSDGSILTCSSFIGQLCAFVPHSIVSQWMYAGGATAIVEAGVAPVLIQATGRWSLDTFNYIWKNVFLLEALLIGHPTSLQTRASNSDNSWALTLV